jgi:hypothetical protein
MALLIRFLATQLDQHALEFGVRFFLPSDAAQHHDAS